MRRGKLERKSIILIIVVAFFTIMSFLFDQMVIRTEDNLRSTNIDLKNIENQRAKYEIMSKALSSFGYDAGLTLYTYYLNRNFIIKSIIAAELKKDVLFFENKKRNIKDLKYDLIYQLDDVTNYLDQLYINYTTLYSFNKKLIEEIEENKIENLDNLFSFHFPDKDFKKEFFIKEKEKYFKMIYLKVYYPNIEDYYEYISDKIEKFNLRDWVEVNNYKLLTLKMIDNDLDKLEQFIVMLDDQILTLEKEEEIKFNKLKSLNINKNYFILTSITSQIFSLLFLLLLFRSFLNK